MESPGTRRYCSPASGTLLVATGRETDAVADEPAVLDLAGPSRTPAYWDTPRSRQAAQRSTSGRSRSSHRCAPPDHKTAPPKRSTISRRFAEILLASCVGGHTMARAAPIREIWAKGDRGAEGRRRLVRLRRRTQPLVSLTADGCLTALLSLGCVVPAARKATGLGALS